MMALVFALFVALALPGRLELGDTTKAFQETRVAFAPRNAAEKKVLAELERQYDALARGFTARDTAAIMGLRSSEFSALFPDGRRDNPAAWRTCWATSSSRTNHPSRCATRSWASTA